MEEKNSTVYDGMNIEQAANLYEEKEHEFLKTYKWPLLGMIQDRIIGRIRELDGRTKEQIINSKGDHYECHLPFHIDVDVPKGKHITKDSYETTYINFLTNGICCGSAVVSVGWFDREEKYQSYIVRSYTELWHIYRKLVRMGFFDPGKSDDFRIEH